LSAASVPVIVKPNAGLPKSINGKTVFDVSSEDFSDTMREFVAEGVRVVGGCCGTTPEYIKKLKEKTADIVPAELSEKHITVVSSYSHAVSFGETPILIGERINPTGKKRFKQALLENDIDYILKEGINQEEKGVHILDVNVGLPDINEPDMLESVVKELQAVTDLPLQIDTGDAVAMERALRRYNGKAMINSVNGKKESMEAVFPLVKKYGGLVVALTLDENGIPESAEARVAIAERILKTAETYGIKKKDIIFDTLAMTISSDTRAAVTTMKALDIIKRKLGCHTSLGVSNISFGLPARDAINGTFFALALERGLSAAIMNPYSSEMMRTYYAYRALHGMDENCKDYIEKSEGFAETVVAPRVKSEILVGETELGEAIIKGLKSAAADITAKIFEKGERSPLDIIEKDIIPALDIVGKGFESKNVYLPQLLMSAEAAKEAFEIIKSKMIKDDAAVSSRCRIVLATVKGDIHDIGKNIVKLLLENYGFEVLDLGKDVAPEKIAEETVRLHASLVGLSALMTTTVPSMEKTIKMLRAEAPWCKIMVGGAVLTEEYAMRIGADKYGADAMEAVRFALEIGESHDGK
jgi:5-methyltetrahydrofolate--homocysteine methyltransferase